MGYAKRPLILKAKRPGVWDRERGRHKMLQEDDLSRDSVGETAEKAAYHMGPKDQRHIAKNEETSSAGPYI